MVLSSAHRAGRRWQLRCPCLGLGHGDPIQQSLGLSAVHPPHCLCTVLQASGILLSLVWGQRCRLWKILVKRIFGLRITAQWLESDVVNSDLLEAPDVCFPAVSWLKLHGTWIPMAKKKVQRKWCTDLSSRFGQTGFDSPYFLLLDMRTEHGTPLRVSCPFSVK